MRSIYKYPIEGHGYVRGPITRILTVDEQFGNIVLWAEVDTETPERVFHIVPIGTGWSLDPKPGGNCILDEYTYIDTVVMLGGNLVFHVYGVEVISKDEKKVDEEPKKVNNDEVKFTEKNSKINLDVLGKLI